MVAKRIIELLSQLLDVNTTGKQDGDALTYDLATDTWVPGAGGGGGAPDTADYLVGTAQGGLSAEIVVGATPGGELGGTWASPTVDATHSGSSHAATQAAAEATAQAALDAHLSDAADAHDASAISVLDTAADFTATDVEGALAELQSDHEGDAQALADHIADATDAHDASAISILDAAGDFTATEVEGALAELQAADEVDEAALAAHLADSADAHDASAISSVPAGGLSATEVQAALNELDTEKAAAASAVMDGDAAGGVLSGTYPSPGFAVDMATQAELDAHTGDATDAHDASAISILDTAGDFTATEVESALAELQADAEADATALSDHIADASAAHAASAISVDSTTLVGTGTDVQAVFEELDNGIADHLADTADAHDASAISFIPTGSVAATDVQAAIAEVASEASGISASLFDANTVLAADADDTPAALAMGASTILARLAAGNIKAATPAELRTLLDVPTTGEAILDALVDAKGDLIVASAADTVARLAAGANGLVITADSAQATGLKYAYPPGHELAYVEFTGNVTISATTAAGGNDVVSAGAVAFDGATRVCIEFFAMDVAVGAAAGSYVLFNLWDGATNIGRVGQFSQHGSTTTGECPALVRRFLTPTNASHTYKITGYRLNSDGVIVAGAGGVDTPVPGYIRITVA